MCQFSDTKFYFVGFTYQIDLNKKYSINNKRAIFEESFRNSKNNFEVYRFVANSFYQDGDYLSAAEFGSKALEINNYDYPSAWFLADSLTKLNKRDDAVRAWKLTIKLYPYNVRNHFELGKLLIDTDKVSAIIELKNPKNYGQMNKRKRKLRFYLQVLIEFG